jgi:hypothetical protein
MSRGGSARRMSNRQGRALRAAVFAPNSGASGVWSAARHGDVRAAGGLPSGLSIVSLLRVCALYACALQAGKSEFQHTHSTALGEGRSEGSGETSDIRPLCDARSPAAGCWMA